MEIGFRSTVVQGPVANRSLFELNHSTDGDLDCLGFLQIRWQGENKFEFEMTGCVVNHAVQTLILNVWF